MINKDEKTKTLVIFIVIIKTKNKNIVVGSVCCHPSTDANGFNEHFLSILNKKLIMKLF